MDLNKHQGNGFFPLSVFHFLIQVCINDSMEHEVSDEHKIKIYGETQYNIMNIVMNAVSHEEKYKILYNDDENAILYNEYMVTIV